MVTRWFILGILSVLCISCKSYETIDTATYNQHLKYNVAIQNPAEVMEIVYPQSTQMGMFIDWEQKKNSKIYVVTLIDTVSYTFPAAMRYKMKTHFNGVTWQIEYIHRSYTNRYNQGITWWRNSIENTGIK